MNTEWISLARNQRDRKTGEELFDIFDTCGSPIEWRMVAQKILQSDAERIIATVNAPRGLDFHCETALTQARMACRKLDGLQGGREADELLDKVKSHLVSVIEQLEEIAAKLKAAKEAA